ncbi:hypothetical protein ACWEN6_05200 [Sphaerisporangium sp. NPDC004334]
MNYRKIVGQMLMKEIVDFASTGALGDLRVGDPVAKAFRVLGALDTETSASEEEIYAFADIQIFQNAQRGCLVYGNRAQRGFVDFPPGPYGSIRLPTPRRSDLLAALHDRGEEILETQPYVWDQTWWQVIGSGVLLHFDEDGLLDSAVKEDISLKI